VIYYFYILKSEKDNSYYLGSTVDVSKRLIQHNRGLSRYTKKQTSLENRPPGKISLLVPSEKKGISSKKMEE